MWHEVDNPCGGVQVVTQAYNMPRHLAWHIVSDDGAVRGGLILTPLFKLWWCSVLLCACVVFVVVMFASAHYVQLLLLFKC
jgi:hypothetical protein